MEIRNVIVYLATRNSTGIKEVVLRVDENNRVLGEGDGSEYHPPGRLCEVGTNDNSWLCHMFFKRADAVKNYIALETHRVQVAQQAISAVRKSK